MKIKKYPGFENFDAMNFHKSGMFHAAKKLNMNVFMHAVVFKF